MATNQSPQNSQNLSIINTQSQQPGVQSTSLNRTLTPTPPTPQNINQTPPSTSNILSSSTQAANTNASTVNPQANRPATGGTPGQQPTPMDLLKYLRNFLHTLLNLARNSVPDKYPLVRTLIQDLLDDRIDPETFIKKIQIEKNPPSPSLVPFLKKAMAQWRLVNGNQSVPIERFLEMAQGQPSTQAQQQQHQPQQQQQIKLEGLNNHQKSVQQTQIQQQQVNTYSL